MTNSDKPAKNGSAFKPAWGMVLILFCLCIIMWFRSYLHCDLIPWRGDFAAAETEARDSHRPRLLDFSSEFCEPCEEMNRTTWADRRVAAALKNYVPVRIDFLKETHFDERYGVQAIPTLIVLNPDGRVLKATIGYMDADEFLKWLSLPQVTGIPDGTAGETLR